MAFARPAIALTIGLVAIASGLGAHAEGPSGADLVSCPDKVRSLGNDWRRIAATDFGDGQKKEVTDLAASSTLRGRVYVTNGTVVRATSNAGCKWDTVYPAPRDERVPDTSGNVVTRIVAPTEVGLWVASYDNLGGVRRPHVSAIADATPAVGGDVEGTRTAFDQGLPPVGTPVELAVYPSNPDNAFLAAYVLVDEPATNGTTGTVRNFYRMTVDNTLALAGQRTRQWAKTAVPAGLGPIAGLALSPQNRSKIVVWSGSKYAVSTDAGQKWSAVKSARGPITAVDINGLDEIAVFSRAGAGGLMEVSNSDGSWTLPTPIPVLRVAHGQRAGVYAIGDDTHTYGREVAQERWVEITPKGVAGFHRMTFGQGDGHRILLGQRAEALYRFDLDVGERFLHLPPGPPVPPLKGEPDSNLQGVSVTATPHDVTIRPGTTTQAEVELKVAPLRRRLEVFFLIDTTFSMQPAVDELKIGIQTIAEEVKKHTRSPACFGLGEVKDYEPTNITQGTASFAPYKRQQAIDCDLNKLRGSLEKLKIAGGGGPTEEAQALALERAVDGKASVTPPVDANQDAGFTPGSTRIIVLMTDAGFQTAPQYNGYPTMDGVIDELNAHYAKVVGVAVHTKNDISRPLEDLRTVAMGTRTFAPEGGTDCDGDTLADLPEGDPLVCESGEGGGELNIAPAIVGLLLGVREDGVLGLAPAADGGHNIAALRAEGAAAPLAAIVSPVNLRRENRLTAEATLTCGADQAGEDIPVTFVGSVDKVSRASDTVMLHCRVPTVEPPPPPAPKPLPPPPDPPLPPLVKPPVAPIAVPNFNPPVNNPPANMNPNAGFSQQEEEQMQVATVSQGAEEQQDDAEEVELAMSALDRDAVAARAMLGCAVAFSAASGVVLSRRRRTQQALRTVRVRG
jgi:hypothetical protein